MRRRKASQVPKRRKNYYVPRPLSRVMEYEEDGCPKRLKVDYKYGVGLALRNSKGFLNSTQICNFIRVHMPKICCYRTDNWENCIRGDLNRTAWIKADGHVKDGQTRVNGLYKYRHVDGDDNWEHIYPLNRYDPEAFLTYPDLHEKLYNGQVGFPGDKEVEEARVEFMEARAKWRVVKKPMKRKTSKKNDDEGEYYAPRAKRGRLANRKNQNQLEEQDEAEYAENGIEYVEGQQVDGQYVQVYDGLGEDEVLVEADDGNQYIVHRNMLQEIVGSNGTFEQNVENQNQNVAPVPVYDSYNQQNAQEGVYNEGNWLSGTVRNEFLNFIREDQNQHTHFQQGEQMMHVENGQNMQHNHYQGEQNEGPVYHQMEYQPFQDMTNVPSGNNHYNQDFPQGSSSQFNQYQVCDQGYAQPQENVTGSGIQQKAAGVENSIINYMDVNMPLPLAYGEVDRLCDL